MPRRKRVTEKQFGNLKTLQYEKIPQVPPSEFG
jgi:hypothetical protein